MKRINLQLFKQGFKKKAVKDSVTTVNFPNTNLTDLLQVHIELPDQKR
jgi:hypothetical protein